MSDAEILRLLGDASTRAVVVRPGDTLVVAIDADSAESLRDLAERMREYLPDSVKTLVVSGAELAVIRGGESDE